MSKQTKKKKENSKIKDFFRVIISAYSREKDDDNEYTDKTFSLLSSLLFYIIGYGILIFEVLLIVGNLNYYINTFNWSNIIKGIIEIIGLFLILVIMFLLATLMIGTAKEQEKTRGEKSIVVFSAMVSFVAFVVAVIELFK